MRFRGTPSRKIGWLAICGLAACGGGGGNAPDAGNFPAPAVLAGGGIGGGAIDGEVNLYIIDDASRTAVSGARVQIGSFAGTTDATGLFTARDASLQGPQTVSVAATGYESQAWIGANGANLTIDLQPAVAAVPTQATVTGSIAGFSSIDLGSGHTPLAVIGYSHDDRYADAANNIDSPVNYCSAPNCDFSIDVRTGHVALLASIYDHFNGALTLIGFAELGGLVVENGVNQVGLSLAQVDAGNLTTVTVDFDTPPAGLPNVVGIPGIDIGPDGTLEIPVFLGGSNGTTTLAPALAAFSGDSYRLSAVANNGSGADAAQSAVLRHPIMDTTLAAGTWLELATQITATTAGASWQPVAGANLYSLEYKTATSSLLDVTVFDGSTSVTVPDLVAVPMQAGLAATVGALAATLDPTSFVLDTDREDLTGQSAQPVTVGS